MPERKYVLTKVAPGDYILPSNDATALWRIRQYEEGPSHGVESMEKDEIFWGIFRCLLLPTRWGTELDPDDWNQWDFCEGMQPTRKAAIDRALEMR